ncbi:Hypp510 [Branchiostoma lanceolatum]|uniref:Hypp510 protein n=1 Tax=Branchiostoma lanceolatum TaxID=7740 RepID=A0A8J9VEL7_BRALA|nr:Hypp510 [Branchiostoma lanceolatum]
MGCGSSFALPPPKPVQINVIEPTSVFVDTGAQSETQLTKFERKLSLTVGYSQQRRTFSSATSKERVKESGPSTSFLPNKQEENMASSQAADIMISGDGNDRDFINFLSRELSSEGLKVWNEERKDPATVSNPSQRAQAIVEAKAFVIVLSSNAVQSQHCTDEVSLAYISNKAIFPVAKESFDKIYKDLDFGMKLTLAKLNWMFFTNNEECQKSLPTLVTTIRSSLNKLSNTEGVASTYEVSQLYINNRDSQEAKPGFWERKFGNVRTNIPWVEFKKAFQEEYQRKLDKHFPGKQQEFLMRLINKDLLEGSPRFHREAYDNFCGSEVGKTHGFYSRLKEYCASKHAMREVFSMDSTVRLSAIQNLGKFKTPGVVSSLKKLLVDEDPNIRAVAAIALGKTGTCTPDIVQALVNLLKDEDRLVRESTCVSLGYLQAQAAVPHIINAWRNDPISHVREAAQAALRVIGGDEANQAVHITQVLTREMNDLAK